MLYVGSLWPTLQLSFDANNHIILIVNVDITFEHDDLQLNLLLLEKYHKH